MNTSTTTPDPEALRKIAEEFQPAPSRIPFHTLKPYHEFIVMLRAKRASYRSVAELLEKQGVKTSVARVAEYGRIVLDGGKRRKRRKYAHATPTAIQTVPPTPQPAPQISVPNSFHPVFTTPPFTSAQLTTLETTFSADMTVARKLGTDRTLAKKISRQALLDALVQDALYCQGLARHDLNTLLTSGYEVVSTNRTPGPLDTPQIDSIDNSVSGQLTVHGTAVLNGRMYQLQYSLDNGVTWTNAGTNYTSARRMRLAPTTPGKTYLIEICALGGSTGQSAWSNPMGIMAT